MKYLFYDDYSEGVAPQILDYIAQNNFDQQSGYCNDDYSKLASDRIKQAFGLPDAAVHFLPNGTITNVVGLVSMLKPYEGVISVVSGHINTHEAGAIEATGHKILWVSSSDGKLTPELIEEANSRHEDEHTVMTRVVYVTQPTELGTLYSKAELESVVRKAKSLGLYVFLDGARLAAALVSPVCDISIMDYGSLGIDMFYLGGTKNGGLYGEAMVIVNRQLQENFRYYIKQRGALMAKGRIIGQQFARFFDNDRLYLQLAKNAYDCAKRLSDGLVELGVDISPTGTNQLFPILDNETISKLSESYGFYVWSKVDSTRSQIRLVTSWSCTLGVVDEFLKDLKAILQS